MLVAKNHSLADYTPTISFLNLACLYDGNVDNPVADKVEITKLVLSLVMLEEILFQKKHEDVGTAPRYIILFFSVEYLYNRLVPSLLCMPCRMVRIYESFWILFFCSSFIVNVVPTFLMLIWKVVSFDNWVIDIRIIYLVDFLFYWRKKLLIVLVESFVDRIVGLFIYFLDLVTDSDSDS